MNETLNSNQDNTTNSTPTGWEDLANQSPVPTLDVQEPTGATELNESDTETINQAINRQLESVKESKEIIAEFSIGEMEALGVDPGKMARLYSLHNKAEASLNQYLNAKNPATLQEITTTLSIINQELRELKDARKSL